MLVLQETPTEELLRNVEDGCCMTWTAQWPAPFPVMGACNWNLSETQGVINESVLPNETNGDPELSYLQVFNP